MVTVTPKTLFPVTEEFKWTQMMLIKKYNYLKHFQKPHSLWHLNVLVTKQHSLQHRKAYFIVTAVVVIVIVMFGEMPDLYFLNDRCRRSEKNISVNTEVEEYK